jgi:hypothetical protein
LILSIRGHSTNSRGAPRRNHGAQLLAVLLVLAVPAETPAQSPRVEISETAGTTEVMIGNVAFSALASGITSLVTGHPFWRSAAAGALGGLVSFGGKEVIASDSDGLGFLGREISAVGASIARNGAFGVGLLDSLTLPVGPLRLRVGTRNGLSANVRVDLNSLAWAAYGLADSRYELDLEESLHAGVFVFYTDTEIATDGEAVTVARAGAGAVFLSTPHLAEVPRSVEHELVHVAQFDFLQITLGGPAENAVLRRVGAGAFPAFRFVELGVGYYPLVPMLRPLLEKEADYFESR